MVSVSGKGKAIHPDFIIIYHLHVWNYHSAPQKYIKLLCINFKTKKLESEFISKEAIRITFSNENFAVFPHLFSRRNKMLWVSSRETVAGRSGSMTESLGQHSTCFLLCNWKTEVGLERAFCCAEDYGKNTKERGFSPPSDTGFYCLTQFIKCHKAIHSLVLLENNEPCMLWYQINGAGIESMLMISQLEKCTKFNPRCKMIRERWVLPSWQIFKILKVKDFFFFFICGHTVFLYKIRLKGNSK